MGLATNTLGAFDAKAQIWIEFCNQFQLDALDTNENDLEWFMCYCAIELHTTSPVMQSILTAINLLWKPYRVEKRLFI